MTKRAHIIRHIYFPLPSIPDAVRVGADEYVRIGSLTDAQLRKIGRAWTDALIEKAKKQRQEEEV